MCTAQATPNAGEHTTTLASLYFYQTLSLDAGRVMDDILASPRENRLCEWHFEGIFGDSIHLQHLWGVGIPLHGRLRPSHSASFSQCLLVRPQSPAQSLPPETERKRAAQFKVKSMRSLGTAAQNTRKSNPPKSRPNTSSQRIRNRE